MISFSTHTLASAKLLLPWLQSALAIGLFPANEFGVLAAASCFVSLGIGLMWAFWHNVKQEQKKIQTSLSTNDLHTLSAQLRRKQSLYRNVFADLYIQHNAQQQPHTCITHAAMDGIQGTHIFVLLLASNHCLSDTEIIRSNLLLEQGIFEHNTYDAEELANFIATKLGAFLAAKNKNGIGLARIDYYGKEKVNFHFATCGIHVYIFKKETEESELYPKREHKHIAKEGTFNLYKFNLKKGDRICLIETDQLAKDKAALDNQLQSYFSIKHEPRSFCEISDAIQDSYLTKLQQTKQQETISFVGIDI